MENVAVTLAESTLAVQNSLIITLPGSVSGSVDTMNALFPYVLHLFAVRAGDRHEK